MIAVARRTARLEDLGDPGFRSALEVLARSIDRDARLHFAGRMHFQRMITAALVTRLRLAEARARRPELDRAPLRPPLIVCGLPRSGTTFLHRMLAAAPDARALRLWELMEPIAPASGPDRRREEVEQRVARLVRVAPSIDVQHFIRPDLPDECSYLFRPNFLSIMYWHAPAYEYLEWLGAQDLSAAYRDYRAFLVLLQEDPGLRFTLKDPFHAASLPELLAVLPEAMVVQTHREPAEVVPSFHKLTYTMHALMTEAVDPERMAEANTAFLAQVARKNLAARAAVPVGKIFDADYRELVRDPLGMVRAIYRFFGLSWSAELEARFAAFVAENSQRKRGENIYAPELFGQTAGGISARFADYRGRFIST